MKANIKSKIFSRFLALSLSLCLTLPNPALALRTNQAAQDPETLAGLEESFGAKHKGDQFPTAAFLKRLALQGTAVTGSESWLFEGIGAVKASLPGLMEPSSWQSHVKNRMDAWVADALQEYTHQMAMEDVLGKAEDWQKESERRKGVADGLATNLPLAGPVLAKVRETLTNIRGG